jgi:hypothetical protein
VSWRSLILAAVLVGGAGCSTVKPWQREDLARPAMVGDRAVGEERFDAHARAAREGAEGGSGQAGGGCGCN